MAAFLWVYTAAESAVHQSEPATGQLEFLPLGDIEPEGWLRRQMEVQRDGLTGHLDEFWPDIQNSGWIGGTAEGWERMPYWLDGAVPLAYELKDSRLIEKVSRHIDYVLRNQQDDGWLGPEKSPEAKYQARDPWPVFVMMKVLTQYAEATGDSRVLPALEKFLRCLDAQMARRPLFEWNRMRWQDAVVTLDWLQHRDRAPWLDELARRLKVQGFDWMAHFSDLPFKQKVPKWEHESHVVNNAMGVKAAAVWYRQARDPELQRQALAALRELDRYHGQVTGIFSGDECFAGLMPSQGTETCAVVEFMYSLEWIVAATENVEAADRLEQVAFNALPAAMKPDWWARQYVQQANQPIAKISPNKIYTTNGEKANLFGLETNYGCCTANLHQGWPKFVSSLWMRKGEDGLAAVAYAPSRLRTTIREVPVAIDMNTDYPFSEQLEFNVRTEQAVEFTLWLRIPAWAEDAALEVPGRAASAPAPGRFVPITRTWNGSERIRLTLPMRVKATRRFNQSVSLIRGPLVLSLKVGTDWKQVSGKIPHADWEVYPTTPWNYALDIDPAAPESGLRFRQEKVTGAPFSDGSDPVRVVVRARQVPEWVLERDAAAPPPLSPVLSNQPLVDVILVPYGTTPLRISEFPLLRESKAGEK